MTSPRLPAGLDLSFLSGSLTSAPEPTKSAGKDGSAGKVKKQRNRKHHSCEPCRQRKVKCDRQSNCANCRLHHKRCFYVDAKPVSNSPEDELVAAREEIERLRALVGLLMQGAANGGNGKSNLSSASSNGSSGNTQPNNFTVLASPSFSTTDDLSKPPTLLSSLPVSTPSALPLSLPLPSASPIAPSFTARLSSAYRVPAPLPSSTCSTPSVALSAVAAIPSPLPAFPPAPTYPEATFLCA
ncbi:hypothetical protein JCM6882_008388 [Rhodosporidiobolus microsporus]